MRVGTHVHAGACVRHRMWSTCCAPARAAHGPLRITIPITGAHRQSAIHGFGARCKVQGAMLRSLKLAREISRPEPHGRHRKRALRARGVVLPLRGHSLGSFYRYAATHLGHFTATRPLTGGELSRYAATHYLGRTREIGQV